MARHIAGQPHFIVQSMPGAGGLNATNYLYNQAPQDGTTIGIVHSTVPLAPLWNSKGVRFDTLKFNWLGSLDRAAGMCITWHTSPIKTWNDLLTKESTVGSTGAGSQMEAYPALLNRMFGTKMKVIGGYKAGTDIFIAMERGEVDGRCGGQLTVIKSTRPDWLTGHKISVPILIAQKRIAEFPDTPTVLEFVKDEATRQELELMMVPQSLDRPGDGAARRSRRPRQGTARCAGRDRCRSGFPGRHRDTTPSPRSGDGRGNDQGAGAGLLVSARSHRGGQGNDVRPLTCEEARPGNAVDPAADPRDLDVAAGRSSERGAGGRALFQRQDRPPHHQRRRRRRLWRICPHARRPSQPAHPRSAAHRRPKHAGRRRPAGDQLSLQPGAAGRQHHRHHQCDRAA